VRALRLELHVQLLHELLPTILELLDLGQGSVALQLQLRARPRQVR